MQGEIKKKKKLCLNIGRDIENKYRKLRKEELSGTVKNAMLCIYSFIRELNHIKLHTALTPLNFFQKPERFLINEACQQEISLPVPGTVIQKA